MKTEAVVKEISRERVNEWE